MEEPTIIIDYLADHTGLIETCASWAFGQWGCQSGGSLERATALFSEGTKKGSVPLTLVALVSEKPAGMISLWQSDFDGRPDLSPWLASLFVHPSHRKKGIASRLIKKLEAEACRLSFQQLYLVTEESRTLYQTHGWSEIDHVVTAHGEASLMSKRL